MGLCLKPIKARVMRITELDQCGVPLATPDAVVVTDGFISVAPAFEYEEGDEFLVKNAWGDLCINEKDPDRLKRLTLTMAFCEISTDAVRIIAAGRPLVGAGPDAAGLAFGESPQTGRFALELWQGLAGAGACAEGGGSTQWLYWVFPSVGNGRFNDFTVENGPTQIEMTGTTKGSPEWGTGVHAAPLLPEALLDDEHFAYIVTTTAPPTPACDATAVAAVLEAEAEEAEAPEADEET